MKYLLTVALVVLSGTAVEARRFNDEAYTLARVCVGEASFYVPDCAPIAEALRNQARQRGDSSLVPAARSYSALFKSSSDRKTWVLALPNGFEKPEDWPEDLQRWATVAKRWRNMLLYANHLIRTEPEPRCTAPAWHWGAREGVDKTRAEVELKAGRWERIDCGNTLNLFYTVPTKNDRYALN